MLHAVVMAGGSGTRFWPESRELRPKQLLNMTGGRSMLQETIDRLAGLVPPERIVVATGARLAAAVREQLPEIPAASILAEPCKRDTAPCIGLAAFAVLQNDPQAVMAVLPSDHVIHPPETFREAIRFAAELVEKSPGRIATFGIRPTYPAESFGYIERGDELARSPEAGGAVAYRVLRFREKPKAELAAEYLAAGNFFWNAGIFVWKAAAILQQLQERQPEMYARLAAIADRFGQADYESTLEREFAAIRGVSVDYAIMEHARDVAVIEAPFAWDDLGSWQALARLHGQDEHGNTILADHVGLNTSGTIVRGAPGKVIVTMGIQDCIIVQTPDATLVAQKRDEESIRQVVKLLQEKGWGKVL